MDFSSSTAILKKKGSLSGTVKVKDESLLRQTLLQITCNSAITDYMERQLIKTENNGEYQPYAPTELYFVCSCLLAGNVYR